MQEHFEDDKLFNLYPDVCKKIDALRKSYYQNVSDDDRKCVKAFYEDIKQDRELLCLFVNRLNKTDGLQSNARMFNVSSHLQSMNTHLNLHGKNYIENYASSEQFIGLNTRNLFRTDEFLPEKEAIIYKKQVLKLLKLLSSGKSKVCVELGKILNDYTLDIKISNSKEFNGSIDIFQEQKKAVICVDKGLFNQDESVQAFMLAHELGHLADYANRPTMAAHIHQITEECFADVVAATVINEAGFYSAEIIKLLSKIPNDNNHPKVNDRIDVIKSIVSTQAYPQQIKIRDLLEKKNCHC